MHEYPRNEQMSFEVVFVGKTTRRKLLQENKFVVNQGGLRSLSTPISTQQEILNLRRTQFNEVNKALNSYLKHLASTGKIAGTIHKILSRLKLSKSCLRAENWRVQIRKYLALCCRQHCFMFRYISVKEAEKIKVL